MTQFIAIFGTKLAAQTSRRIARAVGETTPVKSTGASCPGFSYSFYASSDEQVRRIAFGHGAQDVYQSDTGRIVTRS